MPLFISTDIIDPLVQEYARQLYDDVGIEFVMLDYPGFLRHFPHLFHRSRWLTRTHIMNRLS